MNAMNLTQTEIDEQHEQLTKWQQEAARLKRILGDLRRELHTMDKDVSPTIPMPCKSAYLRHIAVMEQLFADALDERSAA